MRHAPASPDHIYCTRVNQGFVYELKGLSHDTFSVYVIITAVECKHGLCPQDCACLGVCARGLFV